MHHRHPSNEESVQYTVSGAKVKQLLLRENQDMKVRYTGHSGPLILSN